MIVHESELEEIRRVFRVGVQQRDPYYRYTMLAKQIGNVGQTLNYFHLSTRDDLKKAYHAQLQKDLADLLVQVIALCELHNLSISTTFDLGLTHLEEGINKFVSKMEKW